MCELSVSNFVLRGIMCVNAFEFSLFVVLRHVLVHASCDVYAAFVPVHTPYSSVCLPAFVRV
jgi:hypothetical protein